MTVPPPLALYIHIPWCERKCPYCDFNSHEQFDIAVEEPYVTALFNDLDQQLAWVDNRHVNSIFFGGGTPSLFSARAIDRILQGISQRLSLSDSCEITLESNPGSAEANKYQAYRQSGVNRLSIGVQSFNDKQLSRLGRVHSGQEARGAIAMAQRAGFKRLNVDLIFGLPEQRVQQALADLTLALDLGIDHLSWYQLTIERNTAFWSAPPSLPASDVIDQMQRQAEHLLNKHGLKQYEISAWSSDGEASVHNLNYWRFGDYLAIGAGAHGKVTNSSGAHRFKRTRMPQHYLEQFAAPVENAIPPIFHRVPDADIPSEFMMNALRLKNGVETPLYEAMTGLPLLTIASQWEALQRKGLMISRRDRLATTQTGYRFLDDVIEAFV